MNPHVDFRFALWLVPFLALLAITAVIMRCHHG